MSRCVLNFSADITRTIFRYTILGSNYVRKIDKFPASRPIWFIYPGIGSQWKTMGLKLLNISTFKKTFDRCSAVLKPLGIDLYYLVTSDDKKVLEDITSAVVAINAIQIALTDVLQSLGIVPDGYAGQCFGEVGTYEKYLWSGDFLFFLSTKNYFL